MRKKLIGILFIGLMVSTIFPVISAVNQPKYPLEVQISIKGGLGFNADIKNNGATNINDLKMTMTISGIFISQSCKFRESTVDIKAGESLNQKIPAFGFGTVNLEIRIGDAYQSASGILIGWFVLGVK